MQEKTRKNSRRWLILLLFIIGFGGILQMVSVQTKAADRRHVKVAFFPMEGYHELMEDGAYAGMDVEYLNALGEYTNWEIEYVTCKSWEDALQKLEAREVDLVGSAQYSYERSQIYQYADLASGYTFGVIAANSDSTIAYEDFSAMKDMIFGMVGGYIREAEFTEYLQGQGITEPIVVQYATTQLMQEALQAGKIDAFVHTFTEMKEGQRMIGRFAPQPFYYITYQGNDDVLRELNQAIANLKMQMPELENTLMKKYYYERFDQKLLLTTEEKAYILEKPDIIIGYLADVYPFSYEEEDVFTGLSRDLLESTLEAVGFRAEYRGFATMKNAKEALRNGEIDVLSYSADTEQTLKEQGLKRVCVYAESPLVLVMKDGTNRSDLKRLATVSCLQHKAAAEINLDELSLTLYETQMECLDAVKYQDVDAVLCGGYLAEHLLKTDTRYNKLHIESVLNGEYEVSLVIREENAGYLESVLSKAIGSIDLQMINEYMLKGSTYQLVTFTEFVEEHSMAIIVILLVLLLLACAVTHHIVMDGRKIQKLMYKDAKLNIWNLNYLLFRGEHQRLNENKERYAVAYINLTQFRRYNVVYGWNAGEHVLESIAEILKKHVDKRREVCARDQVDRFALLLVYSDQQKLLERLQELKADIEKRIFGDERWIHVRAGVYLVPPERNDLRQAVNCANQVLEFIDEEKAEEIQVYDATLEQKIKERHERERLLDSADPNKDFVAYYQSKVDIRTNEIVGAEALVRFIDPTDGGRIRAPGYFVPYYERTGKIVEIDFFVLEEVCRLLRRRMDAGEKVVPISCNFSRMHFEKQGFPDRLENVLNKYQVPKQLIEIEITETLIIEEIQHDLVKQTLDELRKRDIHLAIDDFGAGYSSLGVFEQIPASVIKLDRSFLLNQQDRSRQVKIMRGIVKMSEDLAAQIVCEGVETDEDVKLMKEIGAYLAQGYFYSKPIAGEEFEERLSAPVVAPEV